MKPRESFIEDAVRQSGAGPGTEFEAAMRDLAGKQWDAAHAFAGPWEEALKVIREEMKKQGKLMERGIE